MRAAIYDSLQNLILFPHAGRLQQTEGVRKFVTRKYAYLVYYTVNDAAGEIVILSIRRSDASTRTSERECRAVRRCELALFGQRIFRV